MHPDITQIPRRSSKYYAQTTQAQTRLHVRLTKQADRRRWLLGLGMGMFIMLVLYVFASRVVLPSYMHVYDQWHYGDSHVTYVQASVYPGKPSSDIFAWDTQGTAFVVVITDKKGQAYEVALKADVVIISLVDISGKGLLDIVLHDEQQTVNAVLYNTGNGFRSKPE